MSGCMNGLMEGLTNEWVIDEWTNGQTDERVNG